MEPEYELELDDGRVIHYYHRDVAQEDAVWYVRGALAAQRAVVRRIDGERTLFEARRVPTSFSGREFTTKQYDDWVGERS